MEEKLKLSLILFFCTQQRIMIHQIGKLFIIFFFFLFIHLSNNHCIKGKKKQFAGNYTADFQPISAILIVEEKKHKAVYKEIKKELLYQLCDQ